MDTSVLIKDNCTTILQYVQRFPSGFLYYLVPNGHSIVSATHPKMLEYIPIHIVNNTQPKMPQASGMLFYNTEEVRHLVFKWAILCSLQEHCIAPKGSTVSCGFNFPEDRFGGCHRYDQSMFSVLVYNAFDPQSYILPQKLQTFAAMERMK